MASQYKHTLRLPNTEFGLRANLPTLEPTLLERWQDLDMYRTWRENNAGAEIYTIHDGPPYANGHIHVGHAQGHVTKDIVMRSQTMLGKDARYVPGWDCHGLPIEWKIEEQLRKEDTGKSDLSVVEFRAKCRDSAQHWVEVQKAEFKRMGVLGDWDNSYVTMDYDSEAQILRELFRVFDEDLVYQDLRPVLWSVVEQTALAEAEAEYRDKTTQSVFASFPIASSKIGLNGASCLIWTTTPWTLPANRGIAYKSDTAYSEVRIDRKSGPQRLVIASDTLAKVLSEGSFEILREFAGTELEGTVCEHPLNEDGYDFDVPLVEADFVTTDQGTGLVHLAPAYGADEFSRNKSMRWDLEVADVIEDNGVYKENVPLFAGQHIFKADQAVFDALKRRDALFSVEQITHSYPHSWRSKKPLIYRATPQWFVEMDTGLRANALAGIESTNWLPQSGHDRIAEMVGNRPDWCISRQRSWGVPMAFFVHRKTGHVLRDSSVDQRILDAFEEIGADAWYAMDPQEFLGTKYEAREYKQVFDVLDVWFESGCTHAFVLDKRDDQKWPADLYLEGSDQHRGWFQSSLLQATATRGQPPFKTVVTHGFVNDKTGRKMSKSDGNVLSPITIADQLGADIFRLWSATVDWKNDMRLGDEALRGAQDMYRKFRNTLRFVAGNLDTEVAPVEMNYNELPLLEQFVLTRLKAFADDLPDAIEMFEIGAWLNKLHAFCDTELSRLYFDIRKDTLYCDRPDDPVRMACQHVLWWLYRCLSRWLAPVLVFTTEELFLVVEGSDRLKSIHFDQYPSLPEEWSTFPRQYEWVELMSVRKQFLSEMEDLRECKKLTKPSRARVTLQGSHSALRRIDKVQLLELCGVAEIELVPNGNHTAHCCEPGLQISVDETALAECERCRLSNIPEASCDTLCQRCEGIVRADLKEAV